MFEHNTLAAISSGAPKTIVNAVQQASARTGVDFAYLLQQAKVESSFNPNAKAKTSSATGLFQFIESTWLGMVRDYGHKHGFGHLADQIDARGRVSSKAARQDILSLRRDPQAASLFAAEFANENKRFLEEHVGGTIGPTELYLAHFLGASGATGFLNALKKDPYTVGAHILPTAAAANRGVFYDSATGEPRTLKQIYAHFEGKFSVKPVINDSVNPQPERVSAVNPANTERNHNSLIDTQALALDVQDTPSDTVERLQKVLRASYERRDFGRDSSLSSLAARQHAYQALQLAALYRARLND